MIVENKYTHDFIEVFDDFNKITNNIHRKWVCKKCNSFKTYSYHWSTTSYYFDTNLSCDEIIIKNIIE